MGRTGPKVRPRLREAERMTLVAVTYAAAATAALVTALVSHGVPSWAVLLVGTAGFAVASRARLEQPGGLQLTMDMQEAAIVASALLLSLPEVVVVAVLGNGLGQLRRQHDLRVAAVSWAMPLGGVVPAAVLADAVAASAPGPSWVVAGLVAAVAHGVGSWALVRLTLTYVHGRPPSAHALRDLATATALGVPAGLAGVLVATAAGVGWWAWLPVAGLAAAALAGAGLASDSRVRAGYHGVLTHLRALADVSTDDAVFLERTRAVLADAIGCYRTTVETSPPAGVSASVPVRDRVSICATHTVGAAPLRRVDLRLLSDAAEIVGATLDSLEERQALQRVATTDPLTGLGNRRMVEEAANGVTSPSWGVILIDLDNLKAVNDTLGHQVGDDVLREAGAILRAAVRVDDVAARAGGDEFVVLTVDPDAIPGVAGRLAERFQTLGAPAELHVGASIGAAVAPTDGTTLEELLDVADRRMYDEKRDVRRPDGYTRASLANSPSSEVDAL